MHIYRDIISNDELFSDIFPVELIADGTVYKVKGKLTSESFQLDDAAIGGNASAEGEDADAGADASSTSGVDVCLNHKLTETTFSKKDYKLTIQDYMKRVKAHLTKNSPDDVDTFTKGVSKFVKGVLDEFKEYQFWFGEKSPERGFDCMPCLMRWDEETPYLYFFKHGLEEEKC